MTKHTQRGATLAEAAITVLALFTLIIGLLEMSRAFSIYQSATNAAREGARFAVAVDTTTGALPTASDVENHVATFLTAASFTGPFPDCGTAGRDTSIPCVQVLSDATTVHTVNNVDLAYTRVTVIAPYTFFFLPFAPVNITAYSEMRNETN